MAVLSFGNMVHSVKPLLQMILSSLSLSMLDRYCCNSSLCCGALINGIINASSFANHGPICETLFAYDGYVDPEEFIIEYVG